MIPRRAFLAFLGLAPMMSLPPTTNAVAAPSDEFLRKLEEALRKNSEDISGLNGIGRAAREALAATRPLEAVAS